MSAGALCIVVDRAACLGSRACTRRAPRTFAVDAEGKATVLDPAGDPEEAVLAASDGCPNFAIEVRRRNEDDPT